MANDTAILSEVRQLADAVRDLAGAMELGSAQREGIREEGRIRGENVTAQVAAHHTASLTAMRELTGRVDALNVRVEAATTAKVGAPWPLVYTLIGALLMLSGVFVSLYARSNGDDASAAFRDGATLLHPTHTPSPTDDGATTEGP